MLKQLRFKFVLINMTLVTVMLLVIFGVIIYQTQENLENQSIQMMQTIGADPFRLDRPGTQPGGKKPNHPDAPPTGEQPDQTEAPAERTEVPQGDVRLPYFVVQINSRGEVLSSGGGFFDLSDEELILNITRAALQNPDSVGVLKEYNMRFCKVKSWNGDTIVFADISSEQATMNNLVRSCLCIGLLSFGLFLFISFQLANWAVKPVDRAWQQQKQFVADASHELKTPLTVIMTNAELLQNSEYEESAREQFVSSILTMSHQMRGLVEGLLELARVDNGAVQTAFAPVDISTLAEETCMVFEPLYFEKGLTLESRVEPDITIKGSDAHLQQVMKILLDNALKYSAPGTVRLTLLAQGSGCQITVSNPGQPISQEDLKNVFKRFYRVDKSRHRDGSYGLGLSIAETIVREHGGRIWAESNGGQNRFHVQLPGGN